MPMRPQPPWTGEKTAGCSADEGVLLLEGEFEDAATFFLGGEGGEDAVVKAEVGVAHVGALDGFGKLEGEAAEESYLCGLWAYAHASAFPFRRACRCLIAIKQR